MPHLRSRPAPPQGHHGLQTSSRLEDFSPATIYSIPELKEFRQLLSYPTFQQARLAEILLGDCRHQTECSLPTHMGASESQTFDNIDILSYGQLLFLFFNDSQFGFINFLVLFFEPDIQERGEDRKAIISVGSSFLSYE